MARAAVRGGYHPVMSGTPIRAPTLARSPTPPTRLSHWEGVLPGFEELLCLDERHEPWLAWLRTLGYDGEVVNNPDLSLETENERPAEHSVTQFLTDRFLEWLDGQHAPGSRTPRSSGRTRRTSRRPLRHDVRPGRLPTGTAHPPTAAPPARHPACVSCDCTRRHR